MASRIKLTVSHAPFWHNGDSIAKMNLNIMLAAIPAVMFGVIQFGVPALGVILLAISTSMFWELMMNFATKRSLSTGDFDAALIGLLFGMMLPATVPWWLVITGTFVAIVIGKQIYGGLGANPFNPVLIGFAILMISWPKYFDFDAALLNYQFDFTAVAPLAALKHLGVPVVDSFSTGQLIMGHQVGAIGSVFGLGLIIGGVYLIIRGYIRWEITLSYIAGIIITALLFQLAHPDKFAGPMFHLFAGYTLLGAIFLANENSSSPVNKIPMFIFGALGGCMVMLIRNIGAYPDGTVFAILLINLLNPLIDYIRPKALGRSRDNA
jgi:electron transport complex protein RnfD